MKSVGKIAVLAMTLALAGVLTACGGSAASSSAAASSAAASSEAASSEAAATTSTEAASAEAAATTSTEAGAAASAAASTAAEDAAAGADAYTNKLFGVSFNLPEGWAFTSAEEIESMNAASGAGEYGEVDCQATSPDGQSRIMITLEKFNDQNSSQTEAEHAESMIGEQTKSGANGETQIDDTTITMPSGKEIPGKIVTVSAGGAQTCMLIASTMSQDYGFLDIVIQAPSLDDLNTIVPNFGDAPAE